jgi:hypothetical protein
LDTACPAQELRFRRQARAESASLRAKLGALQADLRRVLEERNALEGFKHLVREQQSAGRLREALIVDRNEAKRGAGNGWDRGGMREDGKGQLVYEGEGKVRVHTASDLRFVMYSSALRFFLGECTRCDICDFVSQSKKDVLGRQSYVNPSRGFNGRLGWLFGADCAPLEMSPWHCNVRRRNEGHALENSVFSWQMGSRIKLTPVV